MNTVRFLVILRKQNIWQRRIDNDSIYAIVHEAGLMLAELCLYFSLLVLPVSRPHESLSGMLLVTTISSLFAYFGGIFFGLILNSLVYPFSHFRSESIDIALGIFLMWAIIFAIDTCPYVTWCLISFDIDKPLDQLYLFLLLIVAGRFGAKFNNVRIKR